MRFLKGLVAALTAAALVACGGGGGNAGTSPIGGGGGDNTGGGTPPVATVEVLSSSPQLGSASASTVTISAIVKSAGNVALPNTAISFGTTSGTLSGAQATTNDSGVATVTLGPGADRTNRSITVTATAGGVTGNVQVAVAGSTLALSGPTTVALNTTATYSVTATDSSGAPVAGQAITVASAKGNTLSAATVSTNASGVATVTMTASVSGADTLTFGALGLSQTLAVTVSGEDFAFVTPAANAQIPVNVSQAVKVRFRSGGVAQAGVTVNFAATAGTVSPASAVTDAAGEASTTVVSSSASPATVQATITSPVSAQATLPVEFVATTPAALVLQVTPSAIGPNAAGSTTQQAKLLATVRDVNGNPVKGTTVNFSRLADPSGGNLSQASAVTDSSGQATVQYIAGALTTASNGVQLRATVAANNAVAGDATLTVNQSALFIGLGTGNVISNLDPQTYKKDWVVYVTDANSVAVPNVQLTVRVLPQFYGKGQLAWNGTAWTRSGGFTCANEDANYDGKLDVSADPLLNEDKNGSGTLEPGNVISVTPGTVTTDANGRATISLIYAESYAPWVNVTLRVQAIVAGTESSKESTFTVSGAAADFTDVNVPPAGVISPFGVNDCSSTD